MSPQSHQGVDRIIALLAARQHGVVALRQLVALGLSPRAVRSRVAAGRLHRVHRGVYAVGHPLLTGKARWMSAVLACGEGAVLSHFSAAALHGLRASAAAKIDVSAPRRSGDPHRGIRMHRGGTLTAMDETEVDRIPCTSIARTLLDLASTRLRQEQLAKAVDRAVTLDVFDLTAVDELLTRRAGRSGTRRLREAIAAYRGPSFTRSELEARFLGIVGRAGLPPPRVNQWLGDMEVDFVWPEHGLIVEMDGFADHGGPNALRTDRRRDRELQLDGWRVIRFTWDDPESEVVRTLEPFLRSAGSSGRLRPRGASGARPWR